jgi:hypothetical protein
VDSRGELRICDGLRLRLVTHAGVTGPLTGRWVWPGSDEAHNDAPVDLRTLRMSVLDAGPNVRPG